MLSYESLMTRLAALRFQSDPLYWSSFQSDPLLVDSYHYRAFSLFSKFFLFFIHPSHQLEIDDVS